MSYSRSSLLTIAALALFTLATGCATTAELRSTKQNPAATAEVKLRGPDANDNMTLKVNADHLAPPKKIDGNLNAYVVWTRSQGQQEWTNVGSLGLSKNQTATMKTTTPYSKLNVLITLEKSSTVNRPSEYVALEGSIKATE